MKRVSNAACFGGQQQVWQHDSQTLNCSMKLGVYLPPQIAEGPAPVLLFLSGLTCTEQNVLTKAGAQRYAAEHGLIFVCPDTSPRGSEVADDAAWDLGQGAGFYVNATQAPWADHYQMYDYIVKELPKLLAEHFPVNGKMSITGHSMGGHGALLIALKNPGMFQSVSAFSPIVAPRQVPWGHKAFGAYLGSDAESWKAWDACDLVAMAAEKLPLLVDQGDADGFLELQLKSELLEKACADNAHPLTLRMQPGYDHSFYFISSFIGEHFEWHAKALRA
ncbi:MAG: S-formylglutathione hydrolase [Cognaticolwellia sp.]|jgi:S-formylglutathione hydrolase